MRTLAHTHATRMKRSVGGEIEVETRGGYKACEANVNRTFTVQINPARLQISLLLFSILGLLFKQMRTKPADEEKPLNLEETWQQI